MARTTTRPFDAADDLRTDEEMVAYLEAALEEGDAGVVAAALGNIARAKGMTKVARQAGLGRESLCRALSADGNPELAAAEDDAAAGRLADHHEARARVMGGVGR